MSRFALCPIVCIALVCLLVGTAASTVPSSITAQGKLTDNSGNPLPAGVKSFTFRIFDADGLGIKVWPAGVGEIQSVTTSTEGLWTALVGAVEPLNQSVFADTVRWLEIEVNGTIFPRVRLVTGPYAYRVGTVDGASGGTITGKVSIGPGHTNSGIQSFVAGEGSTVSGHWSTIGGGFGNDSPGGRAVIGGGEANTAGDDHATVGGGKDNQASGEFSTIGGGEAGSASGTWSAVGGGEGNQSTNDWATVSGGQANQSSGMRGTVGGGHGNIASGDAAAVGGGGFNRARGSHAFVGGGGGPVLADSNLARGLTSTVGGGRRNTAYGDVSTVGGGSSNLAVGIGTTIAGGSENSVLPGNDVGDYSFVGGGYNNHADHGYSVIVGGGNNRLHGQFSAVVGGGGESDLDSNAIRADYGFVGGGAGNQIDQTGDHAVIAGGFGNRASAQHTTVGGGTSNSVTGTASAILGGANNQATGSNAAVAGGEDNLASGISGFIGGGQDNEAGNWGVVAGGMENRATGSFSCVPGGAGNVATGANSFAVGKNAHAMGPGIVVIRADYPALDSLRAVFSGQMVLQASSGLYITNSGGTAPASTHLINTNAGLPGAHLTTSGVWTNASNAENKENFTPVNRDRLLEYIAELPITRWNYRGDPKSITHIGPVAQDFHRLFGVGSDDKTISTIDPSGIALAAIQELHRRNQDLEAKVAALQSRLDRFEKR